MRTTRAGGVEWEPIAQATLGVTILSLTVSLAWHIGRLLSLNPDGDEPMLANDPFGLGELAASPALRKRATMERQKTSSFSPANGAPQGLKHTPVGGMHSMMGRFEA